MILQKSSLTRSNKKRIKKVLDINANYSENNIEKNFNISPKALMT